MQSPDREVGRARLTGYILHIAPVRGPEPDDCETPLMVGEAVREFLRDYIDSFESLEVLLLLRRERASRTAEDLCGRLKTRAPLVDDALASLVRARLVNTADRDGPTLYAYAADDPARDTIVDSLERAYRDEPIQVMQLMSANAIERLRSSTIRAFADAFVVRKDKGRG